jgi:hypothetical protein
MLPQFFAEVWHTVIITEEVKERYYAAQETELGTHFDQQSYTASVVVRRWHRYVVALTIAKIPDLIALGSVGQANATAKKSSSGGIGDERGGDAFTPPVSEIVVFPLEFLCFVEGSTPFARLICPSLPDVLFCRQSLLPGKLNGHWLYSDLRCQWMLNDFLPRSMLTHCKDREIPVLRRLGPRLRLHQ